MSSKLSAEGMLKALLPHLLSECEARVRAQVRADSFVTANKGDAETIRVLIAERERLENENAALRRGLK